MSERRFTLTRARVERAQPSTARTFTYHRSCGPRQGGSDHDARKVGPGPGNVAIEAERGPPCSSASIRTSRMPLDTGPGSVASATISTMAATSALSSGLRMRTCGAALSGHAGTVVVVVVGRVVVVVVGRVVVVVVGRVVVVVVVGSMGCVVVVVVVGGPDGCVVVVVVAGGPEGRVVVVVGSSPPPPAITAPAVPAPTTAAPATSAVVLAPARTPAPTKPAGSALAPPTRTDAEVTKGATTPSEQPLASGTTRVLYSSVRVSAKATSVADT